MSETNFKSLKIDWQKATKEFEFTEFKNIEEIRDNNDYLYKTSLVKTLTWLNDFISQKAKTKNVNKGINNIFSIVGERGTGKSSFMETLTYALKKNTYHEEDNNQENRIYLLPKIDPSIFDGKIRLIELFVSSLASEIELKTKECDNYKTDQLFAEKEKFHRQMREITRVFKNMRIEKSVFAENNTDPELLKTFQEQQELFGKISKLIEQFIQIINFSNKNNYKYLALQLDDLDLVPNNATYQTLQDLFNYLKNQEQLVVFMAYREQQLINSVLYNLIEENKAFLDQDKYKVGNTHGHEHKWLDEMELQRQAANFIEKGLPRPQRVYLLINNRTSIKDILTPFILSDDNSENSTKCLPDKSVQEFLQEEVMKATRLQIIPIDSVEFTRFVLPDSLRSTIQFLELLHKMEDYQTQVNKIIDNQLREVRRKIEKFAGDYNLDELENKILIVKNKLNMSLDDKERKDLNEKFRELNELKNYKEIEKKLIDQNSIKKPLEKKEDKMKMISMLRRNIKSFKYFMLSKFSEELPYYYYDIVSEFLLRPYDSRNNLVCTALLNKVKEKTGNLSDSDNIIYNKQTYNTTLGDVFSSIESFKHAYYGEESAFHLAYVLKIVYSTELLLTLTKSIQEDGNIDRSLDNYLSMLNGKIMEDGFVYYRNIVSGKTSLTYRDSNDYLLVSEDLFYSDIAASGEIRKFGYDLKGNSDRQRGYQYRSFYNKDNFFINTNYLIDLYSGLTYKKKIKNSIDSVLNNCENAYFLYSIFDIDLFVRKSYLVRDNERVMEAMLKRVNEIFTGKLIIKEEKEMKKKMPAGFLLQI